MLQQKCNSSQLRVTAWDFVGVKWESLTPVADRSAQTLLVIIKACVLPGTTIISDCWGVQHSSLQWWTYKPFRQSLCEFRGTWMLTNMIKPTWMHVKVNLGPYWENEIKYVINGFKVSLLAGFDDVAELIVKCCLLPFCWTIYCIYLSDTLKITKIQTIFKKHAVCHEFCYLLCSKYL